MKKSSEVSPSPDERLLIREIIARKPRVREAMTEIQSGKPLNTTRLTYSLLSLGWEPNIPPAEEAHSLFAEQRKFIANFCACGDLRDRLPPLEKAAFEARLDALYPHP